MHNLHELESRLMWCRERYLLRLWQECGSPEAATSFDRFQIAQELLASSAARSREWAMAGRGKLADHLVDMLDHPSPLVRQEAANELGGCCPKDHESVNVLIERARSSDYSFHDRACAASALGQIGAKAYEVIPMLLATIQETKDQVEANELRYHAAYPIENLTGELDVLVTVARQCLVVGYWKSKMLGLALTERLVKRQPDLRASFVHLIHPLLEDIVEEIRATARQLTDRFAHVV